MRKQDKKLRKNIKESQPDFQRYVKKIEAQEKKFFFFKVYIPAFTLTSDFAPASR